MTKISFLNGKFIEHSKAMIHIDDRAMQFADSVYEVTLVHNGNLVDGDLHWKRLANSLSKMKIPMAYSIEQFNDFAKQLIQQNAITTGSLYIQVTRGVAPRNQLMPEDITPTVIMTISEFKLPVVDVLNTQVKVISQPDIRWQMCDVKSTGLLIGSLYKQKAVDLGFDDVIMLRDDVVTECCFSNIFIVKNNQLITHPLDNHVLAGVTRHRIIELAQEQQITTIERKFSFVELLAADEVFSSSTTTFIRPIHIVDNLAIASGQTGEISKQLFSSYLNFVKSM